MSRRIALVLLLAPSALHADPPIDALPPGAIARLGSYRFHNDDVIVSMVVSPDGRLLATGSTICGGKLGAQYHKVCVMNAVTGERVRTLTVPADGGRVEALRFSPDGRTLAAAAAAVHVWDVPTGRRRLTISDTSWGRQLVFTADGRELIVAGANDTVVWLDLDTGKPVRRRDPWPDGRAGEQSKTAAVSPDGRVIAFAVGASRLRLVDAATGRVLREVPAKGSNEAVTFFADGKTLVNGLPERPTQFQTTADGKPLHGWANDIPGAWVVAQSPDGRTVATAHPSGHLVLRELATGEPVWSRRVRLRLDAQDLIHLRTTFYPDGKTLAIADHAWVRRYDARTGEPHRTLGHTATIADIRYADDGRTIRTSTAWECGTWDVATGWLQQWTAPDVTTGHHQRSMYVADDILLALIQHPKAVPAMFDMVKVEWVTLQTDSTKVNFAKVSADGRRAVLVAKTQDGAQFDFFELATGKRIRRVTTAGPPELALSPHGTRFAYLDGRQQLMVADVSTGRVLCRLTNIDLGLQPFQDAVAFTADGRTLAAWEQLKPPADDGPEKFSVRLFSVDTGLVIGHIRFPSADLSCGGFSRVVLSPDGRIAAGVVPHDAGVCIFETASGILIRRFTGHPDTRVTSVAFAPDGRSVATGSPDGVVLVWDTSLSPRTTRPALAPDRDLPRLWTDLNSADAATAWAAVVALVDGPDTVRFLRSRLGPVRRAAPADVQRRVERLSSASFADREQATRELTALGEAALSGLEQALATPMPPEGQKRVQALLDAVRSPQLTGERLRQWRAVAVLERTGTPEAVALLKELAGGMPEARLTRDSVDARDRLAARKVAP